MAQRPVHQLKSWKVGRHLPGVSVNAFSVPLELCMLANACKCEQLLAQLLVCAYVHR